MDVIIPNPELRRIQVQIDGFESPEIFTYSLESTIAEKWDAMISRMETTSRLKDYYDIYYLACNFCFQGKTLQSALYETLRKRETSYGLDTLKKISEIYLDEGLKKRWDLFCKNSLELTLEFEDVVHIIVDFVGKPFDAIVNKQEFTQIWDPMMKQYE